MGPNASAGKKVKAATIRITPTSRTTKTTPLVGKVPALGGTMRLAASEPVCASAALRLPS